MEANRSRPDECLVTAIAAFLDDLTAARRSSHTRRAYATTLYQLAALHPVPVQQLTTQVLQRFFATHAHLQPASRARQQAAVNSFLTWAVRHGHIPANPMLYIERVQPDPPDPRGVRRVQVEAILAMIPPRHLRDRLFFRLLVETGLRVSEALGLYVEDLDLTRDDEHLRVVGKGGQRRTVLLDDPALVLQLRNYLKQTGYQHGALFRAAKNGDGGAVRYQTMQERWTRYCAEAGVQCTLHQLRHTHATELVNGEVSLATIRKRLGHKRIQTTLRYAEQADATVDAEVRVWRRHQKPHA